MTFKVQLADSAGLRDQGIGVVLRVQAATGIPDPARYPAPEWAARLRDRQQRSVGVWVACSDSGTVVGHALAELVPADHDYWAACPAPGLASAAASGALVEIGGLAVDPDWMGRGVASGLLAARLVWLQEHGHAHVVSSAWSTSAGSRHLGDTYGVLVEETRSAEIRRYVYPARPSSDPGVLLPSSSSPVLG